MPSPVSSLSAQPFENPDRALDRGTRQWRAVWRRFASQWSQPELMKLAESVFPGGRHLHSSQISRFSSGNFRDPSPKLLLVIGTLNQTLAAGALPEELRHLWDGREAIRGLDGQPLGPTEIFLAITGQLDLGVERERDIPFDAEPGVCRNLRRFLRQQQPSLDGEWPNAGDETAACIHDLLKGKVVPGFRIVDNLQAMAEACGSNEEELWDLCGEAIAAVALSTDPRSGLRGRPRKLRHPRHTMPFGRSIAHGSPQLNSNGSRPAQLGPSL